MNASLSVTKSKITAQRCKCSKGIWFYSHLIYDINCLPLSFSDKPECKVWLMKLNLLNHKHCLWSWAYQGQNSPNPTDWGIELMFHVWLQAVIRWLCCRGPLSVSHSTTVAVLGCSLMSLHFYGLRKCCFCFYTLQLLFSHLLYPLSEVSIWKKKCSQTNTISFSVRSCPIHKFTPVYYLGFHFPESLWMASSQMAKVWDASHLNSLLNQC